MGYNNYYVYQVVNSNWSDTIKLLRVNIRRFGKCIMHEWSYLPAITITTKITAIVVVNEDGGTGSVRIVDGVVDGLGTGEAAGWW